MSITLHELADRMRDQFPGANDTLMIKFGHAGMVVSATLVKPDFTRTKIV